MADQIPWDGPPAFPVLKKPYFDKDFLGGAWVREVCSNCGKKLDGYHLWIWRAYRGGAVYCDYCRPINCFRVTL